MTKGKICIFEDEWVFRDEHPDGEPRGWLSNAINHERFVTNLLKWFTGGQPSKVLAYSSLYKGSNAVNVTKTVTGLGHTWVTDTVACTLDNLKDYDVVLLSTSDKDANELALVDYVNSGGNVFIAAGWGDKDSSILEIRYDDFLEPFGLGFSKTYDDSRNNTKAPVVDPENHPVTEGLESINIFRGMPCLDVNPKISGHKILCDGIFGVFEGESQGKVIVFEDERGMMDCVDGKGHGWQQNPDNHDRYIANICNWFSGGKPGKFLGGTHVYASMHTGLAAAFEKAGHSWTTGIRDLPLEVLQQYDGVFLTIRHRGFDSAVFTEYVKSGGCVYLGCGTGNTTTGEATFRDFLAGFGLAISSEYAKVPSGNIPVDSSCHCIFEGVDSIYISAPTPVSDCDPTCPGHCVLMDGKFGIYGE